MRVMKVKDALKKKKEDGLATLNKEFSKGVLKIEGDPMSGLVFTMEDETQINIKAGEDGFLYVQLEKEEVVTEKKKVTRTIYL